MEEIGYTICSDEEMQLYNSRYGRDKIISRIEMAVGGVLILVLGNILKGNGIADIAGALVSGGIFVYGAFKSVFLKEDHDTVMKQGVTSMYNADKFDKERGRQARKGGK